MSKSVGTSASVVGGSLTIAGGILTLTTAGLASPLLIAGIATSSVGAATNIGTSVVERIINSKQVRPIPKSRKILQYGSQKRQVRCIPSAETCFVSNVKGIFNL